MFPRCGVPDAFGGWDEYERFVRFLYDTGSIYEHTQIWWSVRPHLAFPTVEIRICDGAARPRRGAARSPASLYALVGADPRAIDEGEPLPDYPHRLIEENLWRAIRFGLSGELIDLERGDVAARARPIEQLIEWVAPVAEELGAAAFLARPAANAAERQIARVAEGCEPGADLRGAGRKGGAGLMAERNERTPRLREEFAKIKVRRAARAHDDDAGLDRGDPPRRARTATSSRRSSRSTPSGAAAAARGLPGRRHEEPAERAHREPADGVRERVVPASAAEAPSSGEAAAPDSGAA